MNRQPQEAVASTRSSLWRRRCLYRGGACGGDPLRWGRLDNGLLHSRKHIAFSRKPLRILLSDLPAVDPDGVLPSLAGSDLDVVSGLLLDERRRPGSAGTVVSTLAVVDADVRHSSFAVRCSLFAGCRLPVAGYLPFRFSIYHVTRSTASPCGSTPVI